MTEDMLNKADKLFQAGKYSKAGDLFEQCIEQAEDQNPLVSFNCGRCFFETQQFEKSLKHLTEAQQMFEQFGDQAKDYNQKCLAYMAKVYLELGDKKKAKSTTEQAEKLGTLPELTVLRQQSEGDEIDKLADKCGITRALVEEAREVAEMIKSMPKKVEAGSQWFLLDQQWINQWQAYVHFDQVVPSSASAAPDAPAEPQEITRTTKPSAVSAQNLLQKSSKMHLIEESPQHEWMNQPLKTDLQEGKDFMLVTPALYQKLTSQYGEQGKPIIRYGIESDSGETSVELNLTRVQFIALPKATFKQELPVYTYLSRKATYIELRKKIQRILNSILMKSDKSKTIKDMKIWKHKTGNIEDIKQACTAYEIEDSVEVCARELETGSDETVDDYGLGGPEEILLIEVKLNKKLEWIFKEAVAKELEDSDDDEEETQSTQAESIAPSVQDKRDFNTLLRKNSKRGCVGLANLGNTCFMNSGLQCLSNTIELTRYFLFGDYKDEINRENPLGMKGRFASAYASLMDDMWIGNDSRCAPNDLKRTLGSRIERFKGFGQQDSSELVNYVLDLLHEDLNRITKKPYVEMKDDDGRPDEVVAKEYWDGFLARNQSIITDLMYGQLKSTVTCLTCNRVTCAFDPFLSISLPITREIIIEVAYTTSQIYDQDSEDKDESNDFQVISLKPQDDWTFQNLKTHIVKALKLKNKNMKIALVRNNKIAMQPADDAKIVDFELDSHHIMAFEIPESHTKEEHYQIELYWYKQVKMMGKSKLSPEQQIVGALPRLFSVSKRATIIEIKKQIAEMVKPIFEAGDEKVKVDDQEQIHSLVRLSIRDNVPTKAQGKYGFKSKAVCDFSKTQTPSSQDSCEIEVMGIKCDTLKACRKVTLQNVLDEMYYERPLQFNVCLQNPDGQKAKDLKPHFKEQGEEATAKGVTLKSCFNGYERLEVLDGNDQFYCRGCKEHRDVTKKLEIYKVPKIMVIQLRRFTQKKASKQRQGSGFFNLAYAQICGQEKVDELVDAPIDGLDMRPFVQTLKDCPNPVLYDLYGVSNHFGSLNGGHYTANVKNPLDGQWYNMNDSSCRPIGSATKGQIVSGAAYLLFYRKRD